MTTFFCVRQLYVEGHVECCGMLFMPRGCGDANNGNYIKLTINGEPITALNELRSVWLNCLHGVVEIVCSGTSICEWSRWHL